MTPDSELLRRYAGTKSEEAFAELVQRHVNLVYSAALRQVNGDAYLAQDVAQTVFTDLARKAGSLARREVLTGWLYTSAHFAAAKAVRTEQRRQAREQEAHHMCETLHTPAPEPDWNKLRPVLDEAMHQLKEADREAILLRYFENRQFAEVGAKLGLNENAARMRVERALEKLRAVFLRRGVAATATLASIISANAVQLAPAGLAATLASASLAGAGTGTTLTLLKLMTATKLKLGISALVVAGATTAFVVQHQAQENLRTQNESLTQQLTQLKTDNESLSNRLAAAGDTKSLSDVKLNELMKLRGEVGVLRRQVGALGKLQEQNQQLRNEVMAAHQEPVQLPTQGQYEWHQTNTMNAAKLVLLGMLLFSGDNHDQFPTNFSQISDLTKGMTNQTGGIGTGGFEFLNAGLAASNQNANRTILRERIPFRTTVGKWARIYGFGDGHVEEQISEDGNFDAFEQKYMVSPPPNQ